MRPDSHDTAEVRLIGSSTAMGEVERLLARIAACEASVLVEGETGTGKELAARAIHYRGGRSARPFVPMNCGAIPDGLLESELFGHTKGAFTDARHNSPGVLALAHTGTLFLDEVDALSPKAQVSLLRFLQEGKVRPLGGAPERQLDVRVIAASNRDLRRLAAEGHFRLDLFYRLNVLFVRLPPLRARGTDVLLLANAFLQDLSRRHRRPVPQMDGAFSQWLCAYQWPGNVRELENLIEREFLLSTDTGVLTLPQSQERFHTDATADSTLNATVHPIVSAHTVSPATTERRAHSRHDLNYRVAKARLLAEFDRRFLISLMRAARGNVSEAARTAGKERRDFGKLLRKYDIQPGAFRS
jgi:two-component system, NtrC family, response regulator GlrR